MIRTGISRPMRKLNVRFVNFWPNFNEQSFCDYWKFIYRHKNIIWEFNRHKPPNILVSGVFGKELSIIKKHKGIKFLYTRENLDLPQYKCYKNILNNFDLVIGFQDNLNQINIPFYYRLQYYYKNHYPIKKSPKKHICLISKNPHPLRLSLIKSLNQKGFNVDCPGLVGNNIKADIRDGLHKISFIGNYHFNICPENSYAEGYTTEKLYDCCIAGCIPIYWGCEKLNDGFYNIDRILLLNKNLSNYNDILDKTIELINNTELLNNFKQQSAFHPNTHKYFRIISNKILSNLERICL